jgi:LacI family transcriptional regulator
MLINSDIRFAHSCRLDKSSGNRDPPRVALEETTSIVTIRDVAKRAGVSVATASRSLNDRADVHPRTREQVLTAARELSFTPRGYAKRKNETRPRTVGLLTSDPGGRFSMAVLTGAEDALGSGEIEVLLCASRNDPIREQHYLRTLIEREVDGIVVVGARTNPRPPLPNFVRVPVVYAFSPSSRASDTSFVPDDVHGGRIAAEHLIALGRRSIAHITGPMDWLSARDRADGITDAMRAAGLSLVADPMFGPDWTQQWGRAAATMLLRQSPEIDAILCGCDQIAVGVMDVLRQAGRSVPQDVSVVGYDNWFVFAEDAQPRLTTVDMRLESLGREAALALYRAMDAGNDSGVHRLPCQLVIRDSTAPA